MGSVPPAGVPVPTLDNGGLPTLAPGGPSDQPPVASDLLLSGIEFGTNLGDTGATIVSATSFTPVPGATSISTSTAPTTTLSTRTLSNTAPPATSSAATNSNPVSVNIILPAVLVPVIALFIIIPTIAFFCYGRRRRQRSPFKSWDPLSTQPPPERSTNHRSPTSFFRDVWFSLNLLWLSLKLPLPSRARFSLHSRAELPNNEIGRPELEGGHWKRELPGDPSIRSERASRSERSSRAKSQISSGPKTARSFKSFADVLVEEEEKGGGSGSSSSGGGPVREGGSGGGGGGGVGGAKNLSVNNRWWFTPVAIWPLSRPRSIVSRISGRKSQAYSEGSSKGGSERASRYL